MAQAQRYALEVVYEGQNENLPLCKLEPSETGVVVLYSDYEATEKLAKDAVEALQGVMEAIVSSWSNEDERWNAPLRQAGAVLARAKETL